MSFSANLFPWAISPEVHRDVKHCIFSKNHTNCGFFYVDMSMKRQLTRMAINSNNNVIFLLLNGVYKISNQALNFLFLLHSRQ